MQGRFEIKTTVVGSNDGIGEEKDARILNRIARVTIGGWEYEADQRHADLIMQVTWHQGVSGLTHPAGDKKV